MCDCLHFPFGSSETDKKFSLGRPKDIWTKKKFSQQAFSRKDSDLLNTKLTKSVLAAEVVSIPVSDGLNELPTVVVTNDLSCVSRDIEGVALLVHHNLVPFEHLVTNHAKTEFLISISGFNAHIVRMGVRHESSIDH